jgi:hypothetical protein
MKCNCGTHLHCALLISGRGIRGSVAMNKAKKRLWEGLVLWCMHKYRTRGNQTLLYKPEMDEICIERWLLLDGKSQLHGEKRRIWLALLPGVLGVRTSTDFRCRTIHNDIRSFDFGEFACRAYQETTICDDK